jgi:hypothetical protein
MLPLGRLVLVNTHRRIIKELVHDSVNLFKGRLSTVTTSRVRNSSRKFRLKLSVVLN